MQKFGETSEPGEAMMKSGACSQRHGLSQNLARTFQKRAAPAADLVRRVLTGCGFFPQKGNELPKKVWNLTKLVWPSDHYRSLSGSRSKPHLAALFPCFASLASCY